MRNKSDDLRNLPKKRNLLSKTNTPNQEPTQTSRLAGNNNNNNNNSNIKRCKTKSSNDDSSSSRETKLCIGKFFYETGLNPNSVNLPSFQTMISSLCPEKAKKDQLPTCQELKGWIFDDIMKEAQEYFDDIKKSWSQAGCSVILDGWMDEKGRNLVNVLVDCPKGAVFLRSSDISDCIGNMDAMLLFIDQILYEVGVNNVVQIITYSTSEFMKEVGKQLMDKYRSVFWTVSASCCIELMLEKLKGIDIIRETLNKTKTIMRFISGCPIGPKLLIKAPDQTQPFLILENIVMQKEKLKKMFDTSSNLALTEEGKKVADLIMSHLFWRGASTTLRAAIPLVNAIQWMSKKTSKEQIGYIYETIDQVKETIKEGFNGKTNQYMGFWKVIDEVWTGVLYSPLHSAGYFFNPNLFYSSDVYIDPEVATGVLCCIVRTSTDLDVQNHIILQMEKYRLAAGTFGLGCADQSFNISPVLWWSEYGTECPELQRLAVRILSQTCDGASKFQLKRSLAETLLKKGRSPAEQMRLTGLVFLRYNMLLKNFASGNTDDISMPNGIDLMDDDWIVDDHVQNDGSGNVASTELDGGSTTHQGNMDLDGSSSCVYPKVEKGVVNLDGPSHFRPKVEPS